MILIVVIKHLLIICYACISIKLNIHNYFCFCFKAFEVLVCNDNVNIFEYIGATKVYIFETRPRGMSVFINLYKLCVSDAIAEENINIEFKYHVLSDKFDYLEQIVVKGNKNIILTSSFKQKQK